MAGTGDHRGFAFIEFSSVSDAKAAFNALVHSTHLYGRRLVLEWAQGETTLEELRDKTKQHWGEGRVGQEKRARFEIGNSYSEYTRLCLLLSGLVLLLTF